MWRHYCFYTKPSTVLHERFLRHKCFLHLGKGSKDYWWSSFGLRSTIYSEQVNWLFTKLIVK